MPINASYEFLEAEKVYASASTIESKISALEDMIRKAPSHKGAENLRAELKTRLKKLKEKLEKGKKTGKGASGIKKEGYQVVIVGFPLTGKSSLLARLTNAKPNISNTPYSTIKPELGTMDYDGVRAQVVDLPPVGSKTFDVGISNNADCLLLVVCKFEEIFELEKFLQKSTGKRIVVFNKSDLLSGEQERKIRANLDSKKINYVLTSCVSGAGVQDLKKRVFESMKVIRIYMKEPGKDFSRIPAVLPINSTVKDVAESIYKGFSQKVKETRVTGPSSKFANQKVGLGHILKDRDVVEFHSKG